MKYQSKHLQSVDAIPGVGSKIAVLLNKKSIETIEDLMLTLPLRYEDRRNLTAIADLHPETRTTIAGEVVRVNRFGGRGRLRRTVARFSDETAEIDVVWFGWGGSNINVGDRLRITGQVGEYQNKLQLQNPDALPLDEDNPLSLIMPIYSETEGLRQKSWRKIMAAALDGFASEWEGGVPKSIRKSNDLLPIKQVIEHLHRPHHDTDLEILLDPKSIILRSLLFEEMFVFQLGMLSRRREYEEEPGIGYDVQKAPQSMLNSQLGFAPTEAQNRCMAQIEADMALPIPMHRLVHGDVGSGKTLLAMRAAYIAAANGYQTALMAPTEVLAGQHAERFAKVFAPLSISSALLTGTLSARERRRREERIAMGMDQIIIGTHALLSSGVNFANLGLVIVDEQHKFGVAQRTGLIAKGETPDVLVLTATPIPRSLALTVYGDLDVSRLDERPAGTCEIDTLLLTQDQRENAYQRVADHLRAGGQGYIVCPRLQGDDDGGKADVQSVAEKLGAGPLAGFRLGVLHGRMKSELRNEVVDQFKNGDLDALVATTVIEVGLDMPRASVLVVENADNFGLSQLHQLRGRIGRGGEKGVCLLLYEPDCTPEARQRLEFLAGCLDGFAVAEQDLRLRGPGELLGLRQHGMPPLRFAHYCLSDTELLSETREAAKQLLTEDPTLSQPEHEWTRMTLLQRWGALLGEGRSG